MRSGLEMGRAAVENANPCRFSEEGVFPITLPDLEASAKLQTFPSAGVNQSARVES